MSLHVQDVYDSFVRVAWCQKFDLGFGFVFVYFLFVFFFCEYKTSICPLLARFSVSHRMFCMCFRRHVILPCTALIAFRHTLRTMSFVLVFLSVILIVYLRR